MLRPPGRIAVIVEHATLRVTDMMLLVAPLKCCAAVGYLTCLFKSTTDNSNKWSRLQGRSTTIVDL
jgi:hypothetical protein